MKRQLLFDYSNGLLPGTLEFRFRRDFRSPETMVDMGERLSASVDWASYAGSEDTVTLLVFDEEVMEVPTDCLDVKMRFALLPVDPAGVERPGVLMDLLLSKLSEG